MNIITLVAEEVATTTTPSQIDISGLISGMGNDVIFAFSFLAILLIAALRNGIHGGAIIVAILPLVLGLAFSGYLPQPLAFIALFIAGFLTYYVIREVIGGGWR